MYNNILAWTSLVSGFYLIMIAFMMITKNFRSAFFFKFIPLCLGLSCMGVALKLFDIITLK